MGNDDQQIPTEINDLNKSREPTQHKEYKYIVDKECHVGVK